MIDLRVWSRALAAAADRGLSGSTLSDEAVRAQGEQERRAFLESFRDDSGHRRPVDRPFLAHVLEIDPGEAPDSPTPDVALWWAVHGRAVVPEEVVRRADGPVTQEDSEAPLEVWTESELSALHALWHLSDTIAAARRRCLSAARWHIETIQPDNATNHPWAIHVFLALAAQEPGDAASGAARFHAETMLHACQVMQGRPDRLSAWILLDASRCLAELAGSGA